MSSQYQQQIDEIEARDMPGPNKLAAKCELMIPHLIAERNACTDKQARKKLGLRLQTSRMLLRWAKTRAGYVKP